MLIHSAPQRSSCSIKARMFFLSLLDAKMNLMQQSKESHWRRLKSRLLIVNKQFTMDIKCISRRFGMTQIEPWHESALYLEESVFG
jgi:hypothetical protein